MHMRWDTQGVSRRIAIYVVGLQLLEGVNVGCRYTDVNCTIHVILSTCGSYRRAGAYTEGKCTCIAVCMAYACTFTLRRDVI